ncbi:Calx-beta domain-containing protein [Algirhabdus cladophorae]|uniref:Calx-beta domain-containing protein n=1 Tax=Algirhabdus cladophorae TaxID=3377108 RepID=UPI003B849292
MGNYGTIIVNGNDDENDELGFDASGIGDINGDGIADFAITEKRGTSYEGGEGFQKTTGAVYVVYGTEDGPISIDLDDIDGTNGFKIESDAYVSDYSSYSTFGHSVVGLGDVNGDDVDDFAIVENSTDYDFDTNYGYSSAATEGVAYVIYGGQSVADSTVNVTDLDGFRIDAEGEITGVVAIGDFNDDGVADIGLNTQTRSFDSGYSYYYTLYDANGDGEYNPDDGDFSNYYRNYVAVNDVRSFVLYGTDEDRTTDEAIADEGNSDLFVNLAEITDDDGFSFEAGQTIGGFYGGEFGGPVVAAALGSGEIGNVYDYDSRSVGINGASDINGDGFNDLVVGEGSAYIGNYTRVITPDAPDEISGVGTYAGVNNSFVVVGEDLAAGTGPDIKSIDSSNFGLFGDFALGDVSGEDGFAEIATRGFSSAADISTLTLGAVSEITGAIVVQGASDLLDGSGSIAADTAAVAAGDAAFYFAADSQDQLDIQTIVGVGDMNADGVDDFFIAGRERDFDLVTGYLVFGSEEAQSGYFELNAMVAAGDAYKIELGDYFQFDRITVAGVGDVNNDGADDLLFANPDANSDDGQVQIIFGGEALEASDAADGSDDNIIQQQNTIVDVDTGILPTLISIDRNIVFGDEGTGTPGQFVFTVTRNGDLADEVSVDWAVSSGSSVYTFYTDAAADDFEGGAFPSGTVTFADGESTVEILVEVAGDTQQEGFEDFTVTLSNAVTDSGGAITIINDDGIGLIRNDDVPATLSVFNQTATEGDAFLEVEVFRGGRTDIEVTVDYTLTSYFSSFSTAESEDFDDGLPQTGSITFAAGETSKIVQFAITDDAILEGNENATFTLSNADAGGDEVTINRSSATLTILDDERPVIVSASGNRVTETDDDADNVTLIFTVTRSGNLDATASVDFTLSPYTSATTPEDFVSGYIDPNTGQPRAGTIEFAAGETTQTIELVVAGDNVTEGTEYVVMNLSNLTTDAAEAPQLNTPRVFGRIDDDDIPATFRANNAFVTEGETGDERTLSFTVTRTGLIDVEASVSFSLEAYPFSNSANADDFVSGFPQSGELVFAAGETSKTVTAVVSGDDEIETTEYVQLLLSDPETVAGETAIISDANGLGTISNDDFPVTFSISSRTVTEGDAGETTEMVYTVFRSGEVNVGADIDYRVDLYASSQAADDDDLVGGFPQTGSLRFEAGETSQTFTVLVQGDNDTENTEFFQVFLENGVSDDGTAVTLGSSSAFGTITNDDVPVQFSVNAPFIVEGQNGDPTQFTFTINRFGETNVDATVDYDFEAYFNLNQAATDADFEGGIPDGGTLSFAAGETTKTVTLNVIDDEIYESTEYLGLRLSDAQAEGHPQGATISGSGLATGQINDDEVPVYYSVFYGYATEADEGETTTMLFNVSRSGDLSSAGTVDYSIQEYRYGNSATDADFTDALPQLGTVTFAAGESAKQIAVEIAGDNLTESTEYFEVHLSNATSEDPDAQVVISRPLGYGYIYDDDIPVYFRASGSTTVEGDPGDANTLTFRIQRYGDTSVDATVDYSVAGGTADADDFSSAFPTSGSLTFLAGETFKDVVLQVQADEEIEGDEYTYINLTNPSSTDPDVIAVITTSSASGIIRTDDQPSYISVSYYSSATEGDDASDNTALTFQVYRTGDTSGSVSVDYAFAGSGSDALDAADIEGGMPQNGTVTFGAGETFKTITFNIAEDEEIEGNERGTITLSNATGAGDVRITNATGTGVVNNDDFPPRILAYVNGSLFGASLNEGNSGSTPINVTFQRDGTTDGDVEICYDLTTFGGVFGADSQDIEGFLPSPGNSVTILDGENSVTVTININGDGLIEANERFRLEITEVNPSDDTDYTVFNPTSNITIRNDDGRPPIPELPFDVDGDGVIEEGEFIRVEADVFGDPHITTLDGLGYDFQAVGDYVLVETEDGATNPFSVQVRFEAFPGSDLVSITTRMAVDVRGSTIEIDAKTGNLLINGEVVTDDELAVGALYLDDGDDVADIFIDDGKFFIVLNDAGEQLMVGNVDGSLNVCVFLADAADGGNSGNVRGLMGNANQDLTDDFGLRDGSEIPEGAIEFDGEGVPDLLFDFLYGRGEYEGSSYRESWALTEAENLFSGETPDFPENFPAGPLTLDNLPESIRAMATQAALDAGLSPDDNAVIFENAVLDFALTGMGAFLEGAGNLAAEPESASDVLDTPEQAPTVNISADVTSVTEGDDGVQTVSYTFYRIGDLTGDLQVNYEIGGDVDAADLGGDTPMTGTVGFADGEDTTTLEIIVKGDLSTEQDEGLVVSITGTDNEGVLIGGSQGEITILTDDFGPEAQDDRLSTDADTVLMGNVIDDNGSGQDTDADDDELSVTAIFDVEFGRIEVDGTPVELSNGVIVTMNADGSFEVDLNGSFDGLSETQVGSFDFEYEVSDGNGGTDTALVEISVNGVEEEEPDPVTYSIFAPITSVTEGNTGTTEVQVQVTRSAGTGAATVALAYTGTAQQGDRGGDYGTEAGTEVTFADGETSVFVTLEVAGDLTVEEDETIIIDIDVTDAETPVLYEATSATVTITNDDVPNEAPMAEDDDADATVGTGINIDVLANDSDPEEDDLAVIGLNSDDTLGDVEINQDGTVSYDAGDAFALLGLGETATDTFVYTVSDGDLTDTATVTVEVTGTYVEPVGPNEIVGTQGSDRIAGTEDADAIRSLGGRYDRLTGGEGEDQFIFGAETNNGARERDVIYDYEVGIDSIVLEAGTMIGSIRQTSSTVIVSFEGDRDTLYIRGEGVNAGNIDFITIDDDLSF